MKKLLFIASLMMATMFAEAQTTTNIFNTLDANTTPAGYIFRASATNWSNGRRKIEAVDPVTLFSGGSGISISGAGVISATDASTTNEIQTLSIASNTISLSLGGGSVVLPLPDGSETKVNAGTNVTVTGSGTVASPYVINASVAAVKQWKYKTHTKSVTTATLALPGTVPSIATDIGIWIGGVKMTPSTDNYTIAGSTLTFVGGAPNMDVEVWYNEI